jgi:LysR family transcriptional regulator, carnitine catabolism transcriptional activator
MDLRVMPLNVADPNHAIQAFFAARSCNSCIMTESAVYPGDLIEHLRGFATLATVIEEGAGPNAFIRAAGELALDPSVLRRRLQTLVEYVGAPLLSGRGPALKLTMTGNRVRSQATQMIDLASAVGQHGRDEDHVGPLRVACTGTILAEVLPGILAWMRDQYGRLRFRVRREGAESSRVLVEKGEIDFAIIRAASDRDPTGDFHALKVAEDRLWLAVHVNHPLARAKRMAPAEIAKAALVGYPAPSATMKRLMSVLGPLGATPWIEVDRKAAALAYVGAGLGVGFVSRVTDQAPPKHRNVVMRDVTSLFPRTSFWLISHEPPASSRTKWKRDFAERIEMAMLKTGTARNRA